LKASNAREAGAGVAELSNFMDSAIAEASSLFVRRAVSPPRPVKLRVNILWSLAGTAVYSLCQLGILVVLAKLGTHEMLGQFALGLAIASPVMICAGLSSLRIVQATDAHAAHRFQDYLALRILTTVAGLAAVAGILYFASYAPKTAGVVLIVAVAKAIENLSDVFGGLLQNRERMDLLALSAMLRGTLSLLAMAIGLYLTRDVLIAVSCLAFSWALTLILFDVRVGTALLSTPFRTGSMGAALKSVGDLLQGPWNRRALIAIGVLALPVVIAAALTSFNTNIPRYFVEHFLGIGELGKFAAIAYPMAAGITVINAIGQSAMPRLARLYADGNTQKFSWLMLRLVGIATALGIGGVLLIQFAGRPILTLLYRPEYANYSSIFLWLGVGTGLLLISGILGYGVNAVRHFRTQMLASILVSLVAVAACGVLVPWWHLTGAAIAIMLTAAFQAAVNASVIFYALRSRPKGGNA
jgi:O-antigen/teichoic acid export membrane protein